MEASTKIIKLMVLSFAMLFVSSCDSARLKKCEWYLVPEERHIQYVANGWVSICARNYVNKKERCYLRMKLTAAEKVYGKAVTFDSLDLGKGAIKEIKSYRTCTPTKEDQAIKR
jgi:hypothetical protein